MALPQEAAQKKAFWPKAILQWKFQKDKNSNPLILFSFFKNNANFLLTTNNPLFCVGMFLTEDPDDLRTIIMLTMKQFRHARAGDY
jgi:hypothetical protein